MTVPMPPVDPTRRDPGRWCDQHRRFECSKRVKGGGSECHGSRIAGLDKCRMHAGQRSEVAKAKGVAVSAWTALSGQVSVSATEAVLGMLQMSWLRVHLYAQLLQQQVDAAGADGPGGLVGETTGASPGIGLYATGEAIRGLAQLEAQERDRCVKFAKTAHDMGIAEQQISIAEQQGTLFADAFFRILDALDLSVEQQAKAVEVMPRELRAIEGGTG